LKKYANFYAYSYIYPLACITSTKIHSPLPFYNASKLLAMQSAVLARAILSVRLSFRHVLVLCEDTIVRFQHLVGQLRKSG